jgi:endoglucanase
MNEPFGISSLHWLNAANTAIAAIRATGAKNLILVPGSHHSNAHSWFRPKDGPSNAMIMGGVRDPTNNFAIELHHYFDSDHSGTRPDCTEASAGGRLLSPVTEWLRERKLRAFLAEFGGSAEPACLEALDKTLQFMGENNEVWLGWAWWAGGPRWPKDFPFLLDPAVAGTDRPQMIIMSRHLEKK